MDRSERRHLAPGRAVVAEVLLWWAVAYAVYLLSLSAAPLQELLLGAAVSLPCGLAAVGARRATGDRWVLAWRWLRPVLVFPASLLADTAAVLSAAVRPSVQGRFETVPTGALDDHPGARSRRAVATFWMSVTPGSYVLDADPATGDLMVHSLRGPGPSMGRSVARTGRDGCSRA